ncbi:MAG: hypothetical protein AAF824_01140, partial [Bacteroidota bacterium]
MNERGEDGLWEGLSLFVLVFGFVFNKENEEERLIEKLFTCTSIADLFQKEPLPVLRRLQRALLFSKAKKEGENASPLQCKAVLLPQPVEERLA